MPRLKEILTNPLKTAFSDDVSQSLQTVGIAAVGLTILGSLAILAFSSIRAIYW
jgi:hypothetical protein